MQATATSAMTAVRVTEVQKFWIFVYQTILNMLQKTPQQRSLILAQFFSHSSILQILWSTFEIYACLLKWENKLIFFCCYVEIATKIQSIESLSKHHLKKKKKAKAQFVSEHANLQHRWRRTSDPLWEVRLQSLAAQNAASLVATLARTAPLGKDFRMNVPLYSPTLFSYTRTYF